MDIKPSTWVLLGGSGVLFISLLLPWISSDGDSRSGLSGEGGDWFGIFCLLIAFAVGGVTVVSAFVANVNLPENIVGFSRNQWMLMLSSTALLLVLGYIGFVLAIKRDIGDFIDIGPGFGVILSLLAAIALVVGSILADREQPTIAASSTPPTPF